MKLKGIICLTVISLTLFFSCTKEETHCYKCEAGTPLSPNKKRSIYCDWTERELDTFIKLYSIGTWRITCVQQ